jgi:hypothetical protein
MGDFVSQGTIDAGVALVPDALGHDGMARAIFEKAVFLPPGSVVAVQGSWGRGKTDVLMRVAALVRDPVKSGIPAGLVSDALWINPWQYGTPDLLTPLVLAMIQRIPEEPRKNDKRLRKLAETLLRAGLNFGLKAVGVGTGMPILSLAADPVDKMVSSLFEAVGVRSETEKPDADPVSVMGDRFRELTQKLIDTKNLGPDARLIVCIDDLDRCLPDRQVALLEAIRFLISAGAPATFLIALDPTLARQAILTHYKTDAFDPDRYLDKMFDLRVNLPSLGSRMGDLVRHHMGREMFAMGHVMKIGDAMKELLGDNGAARLEKAALVAFNAPDLSNPRIVRRIFDRLYLLALSRSAQAARLGKKAQSMGLDDDECRHLLVWLGITERFPAIRAALQDGVRDGFEKRVQELHLSYLDGADAPASLIIAVHRLPQPLSSPELSAVFRSLAREKKDLRAAIVLSIDEALVLAGL